MLYKALRTWMISFEWSKQGKIDEFWNMKSGVYRTGSLSPVSRESVKYKSDLVGVQEVRWESAVLDQQTIIHSMEMGMLTFT
jgi:hypothetical protein